MQRRVGYGVRFALQESVKKTTRYAQRSHIKRMTFLRDVRERIKSHGSENIVYMDESGFTATSHRPHGWAKRGVKVHGDIDGNNRKSTNLMMAQAKKKWLAPMLFKASCTSAIVLAWMEKMLIPELKKPSVIVMDNAAFHPKEAIRQLLEKHGHVLLPLPPYSPDFNPIEQSFAIIKKRRQFSENPNNLEAILIGNLIIK
jgi:transposase